MFSAISLIAERKISQAIANGELQTPEHWRGRPLPLEDQSHIPPEFRMAYTILKNAGYLPPEIAMRKEAVRLEDLIARCHDEHERLLQMKKLDLLNQRIAMQRERPLHLGEGEYYRKVVERVSLRRKYKG